MILVTVCVYMGVVTVCVHGCGHCVCTWVWSLCVQVGKPNIGENRPSRVRADVTINVKVKDPVRREWEGVSTLCTQLLYLIFPCVQHSGSMMCVSYCR